MLRLSLVVRLVFGMMLFWSLCFQSNAQRTSPIAPINPNRRVTVKIEPGTRLYQALIRVLETAQVSRKNYEIPANLAEPVSGEFENMPLLEALSRLLAQAKANYQINFLSQSQLIQIKSSAVPIVIPESIPLRQVTEETIPEEDRPSLVVRSGHDAEVIALAIDKSEQYLASSDEDVTNLWQRSNQELLRAFEGQSDYPIFTADGKQVLTYVRDRATFWNAETGRKERDVPRQHQIIYCAAPSPTSTDAFLTTGRDRNGRSSLKFWKMGKDGAEVISSASAVGRIGATFSKDGKLVVSWTDEKVTLWKFGENASCGSAPVIGVSVASLSADNQYLVVATGRGIVKTYRVDIDSRRLTPLLDLDATRAESFGDPIREDVPQPGAARRYLPLYAQFDSVVRDRLAVALPGGTIRFYSLSTRQQTGLTLAGHPNTFSNLGTRCFAFSPSGTQIVSSGMFSGSKDTSLKLWNLNSPTQSQLFSYASKAIKQIRFVGSQKRHLIASGDHGTWHWDLSMATDPVVLPVRQPLVLHDSGEWLASPTAVRYVSPYQPPANLYQGSAITTNNAHQSPEDAIRIERQTAAILARPVQGVALWDGNLEMDPQILLPWAGVTGDCRAIAFFHGRNQSGIIAAGWDDKAIHYWTSNSPSSLQMPLAGGHKAVITNLLISPDNRCIVSQDKEGQTVLWNVSTGKRHAMPSQGKLFSEGEAFKSAFPEFPSHSAEFPETPQIAIGREVTEEGFPQTFMALATLRERVREVRCYDAVSGEPVLFDRSGDLLKTVYGNSIQIASDPEGGQLLYVGLPDNAGTEMYKIHPLLHDQGKTFAGFRAILTSQKPLPLTGKLADFTGKRSGKSLILGASANDPRRPARYLPNEGRIRPFSTGHVGALECFDLSQDGKLIASGGRDGTIRVWDAARGKEIAAYIGVATRKTARATTSTLPAAFLPKPGEAPLPVLFTGDYIVAQSDSFYMASKQALSKVSFRIQGETFPFDLFDLRLNRPDKVLSSLRAHYPDFIPQALIDIKAKAHRTRLKKFGLTPSPDLRKEDLDLPQIKFTQLPDLQTASGQATLAVRAVDDRAALIHFDVYVNGSFIQLPERILTGVSKGQPVERRFTVPLAPGKNKIEISVVNTEQRESLRLQTVVTSLQQANPPRLFIFTVGVSKYKTSGYDLKWCTSDANSLSALLRGASLAASTTRPPVQRPRFIPIRNGSRVRFVPAPSAALPAPLSGYREIKVNPPLCDASATRSAILQQLSRFIKDARPEDHLVVFLAGHGFLIQRAGEYYFGCYDQNPATLETLKKTAIGFTELDNVLKQCQAQQKLLLMDTCHAGADYGDDEDEPVPSVDPQAKPAPTPLKIEPAGRGIQVGYTAPLTGARDWSQLIQETFPDVERGSGTQVITASSGKDKAGEASNIRHGYFTYALLQALSRGSGPVAPADGDKDGKVDATELLTYVSERVAVLTKNRQRATARRASIDQPFSFATGKGLIPWRSSPSANKGKKTRT